jgi:diguanylate cyclase (GGDEF)-like protein
MPEIIQKSLQKPPNATPWRPELVLALVLFVAAFGAFSYAVQISGILPSRYSWGTALFFLALGLFTILMGYARPGYGHISFDRVAQVSSILVLGPVDAAWIAGLASFIYPWHRVWGGVPPAQVLTAAIHNAGMMTLVILLCGSLYTYLGGPVPLLSLNLRTAGMLLLLMLSMQIMNDGIMAFRMYLMKSDPSTLLNVFSDGVELAAGLLAILVAIIFVRMETSVFVLLLFAMTLGMLVLKQFAEMRNKLEVLVDQRTEELKEKTLELEQQATHDKLTGLLNRRFADDYLQREIDNSHRHNREFTIALADIDHFKQINDLHSHAVGDAVLCRVAEILTNRCRKTDVVARYGGEEFLLCFPDTNKDFAEQICGQIRSAVEKENWSSIARNIRITISFGVAEVGNDSRRTTVLSDADTCLYKAKNKGRNLVVV